MPHPPAPSPRGEGEPGVSNLSNLSNDGGAGKLSLPAPPGSAQVAPSASLTCLRRQRPSVSNIPAPHWWHMLCRSV
ncbi:hypothetical protein GCM10023186_23790 [Hymenobacter koreensis]|uniref:Uncharacterized protein n=1 Tax=Hymenobacter koreensis TaxID=1084523 RepID=A0ABP8J0Z8_9BACT